MKSLLKVFVILILLMLLIVGLIFWANKKINDDTQNLITSDMSMLPNYTTGLLLGTSKHVVGGGKNLYFEYRIQAAVDLYQAGKIKNIIVSGDNGTTEYNEPQEMKNVLVERGIPEDKIYLDYAGFRTLDSVIRAREIFGQNEIIIISQKFHNQRAAFIASQNGINAFGYNAQDVNAVIGRKTNSREYFARVKVFLDIVFHAKPKFLGEKVIISK